MMRREDRAWYPAARLFRQARRGDLDGVIARVRDALMGFVTGSAA